MFLNAWVRRLHPFVTSLAEDVALPRDCVVDPDPTYTMASQGIEPGLVDGDTAVLTTKLKCHLRKACSENFFLKLYVSCNMPRICFLDR